MRPRLCNRLRNSWGKIQIFLTTVRLLAFSLAWHSKSTTKDKILATTTNGINYNYYWIKSVSDKTKFKSKYSIVWDVCWFCLFAQNICGVKINSNDLINIFIPWFSRLAWWTFSIIILAKKMLVLNHENSQTLKC